MKAQKMLAISAMTILLLLGLAGSQSSAAVIIVDCNGPSDFNSIQEAIDSIVSYGSIEVRPGIYYEHISYYGKTIVLRSTDPNDPNVVESTVIDGSSSGNVVTFNNGEDESCVLAGFTVRNGASGIYCYLSEPLIRNCVVRSNNIGIKGPASPEIIDTIVKENNGTGIYNCDGYISECEITGNSGNGLDYCDGYISECEITGNSGSGLDHCGGLKTNCTVSGNSGSGFSRCGGTASSCIVTGNGAGGFAAGYSGTIEDCLITANAGIGYSGAIRSYSSLLSCLISGNGGWGIKVENSGVATTNCTIVGNKNGGMFATRSGVDPPVYNSVVSNSIIVKNGGYGFSSAMYTIITSKYNNVWRNLSGDYSGVTPGATDISVNPFFAVPGYWDMSNNWVEGEYHLLSTAGRWDVNDWVNDTLASPCIDAGDPCSPIGVEPNPNGGIVNQGVYGGTAEASKSPSGIIETVCTNYPAMDFNKDCKVNFEDFAVFSQEWLYCNLDPQEACWE